MLKRLILVIVAIVGILGLVCHSAFAYNINGSLDDWGVYLSSNDFTPNGGLDIDSVIEDDTDGSTRWKQIIPGWSFYNIFDVEALYFDNDSQYGYIAIVTGLPQGGYNPPGNRVNGSQNYVFKPGDIFIDTDLNTNGYEYALDISNSHLFQDPVGQGVPSGYFPAANPWAISSGTDKGSTGIEFVYSEPQAPQGGFIYKNEYIDGALVSVLTNAHYVLEGKIPLASLGLSANPGGQIKPINIHWTMECGNDFGTLNADVNPVPEPATLSLLGLGLLGLVGLRKKKIIEIQ